MITTQQKNFETLQSEENLLFNQTSGSLMTNNSMHLSKRLANAAQKHTSLQFKWNKQIEKITAQRALPEMNTTVSKKKLQRSLRNTSLGSLMER